MTWNRDDPNRPVAAHTPSQSQLRTFVSQDAAGGAMSVDRIEIRSNTWPMWLTVAEQERDFAITARKTNPGPGNSSFDDALNEELRHSMVSICASAFAIEAFTSAIHSVLPSSRPVPTPNTSASVRVHQTWQYAFKMSNGFSKQSKERLIQLFEHRNGAVHPKYEFAHAVIHHEWPELGMAPLYPIYSSENASVFASYARAMLQRLSETPRSTDAQFLNWLREAQVYFKGAK